MLFTAEADDDDASAVNKLSGGDNATSEVDDGMHDGSIEEGELVGSEASNASIKPQNNLNVFVL